MTPPINCVVLYVYHALLSVNHVFEFYKTLKCETVVYKQTWNDE